MRLTAQREELSEKHSVCGVHSDCGGAWTHKTPLSVDTYLNDQTNARQSSSYFDVFVQNLETRSNLDTAIWPCQPGANLRHVLVAALPRHQTSPFSECTYQDVFYLRPPLVELLAHGLTLHVGVPQFFLMNGFSIFDALLFRNPFGSPARMSQ